MEDDRRRHDLHAGLRCTAVLLDRRDHHRSRAAGDRLGRHVAWGDGIYRSADSGRSWERKGLQRSEHIGRILVDPRDGQVVLVASEGPLWSGGGDRGVFRTTDGGTTWTPVLQIDEHTGVTDLEFDPSNPDVVYAAAYQRRRHVWGFLAGGSGSGIYKSTDNGRTWRKVTSGLPKGDMGKIGVAVTPADPSIVYATIEAGDDERGFYRSQDRGESWERRNSWRITTVSSPCWSCSVLVNISTRKYANSAEVCSKSWPLRPHCYTIHHYCFSTSLLLGWM